MFFLCFQKRPEVGARVVRVKKQKGQVTQNCDIYISSRIHNDNWDLPWSEWANPHYKDAHPLERYERHIRKRKWYDLDSLEGKLLGCWCDDVGACHGSVLIKLLEEKKKQRNSKASVNNIKVQHF